MKITKLHYHKTFPTDVAFSPDKVGVEADLDPYDDVEDCMKELAALAKRMHHNNYPHLYQETTQPLINVYNSDGKPQGHWEEPIQKPTDNRPIHKRYISDINKCTELEGANGLKSFERLVSMQESKYPELRQAYNEKLSQLTNTQ